MSVRIIVGDVRERLRGEPDGSVQTCVTSPPYFGLRDYGHAGQIGLEPTPEAYVAEMVSVFREVKRVLRDDGTLWLNLGDSYAGSRAGPQGETGQMANRSASAAECRAASVEMIVRGKRDAKRWGGGNNTHGGAIKPKDLIGIPWRVAFALQEDGWYLRSDIIWSKPNPMPESVTDRPTKAHEYVFLLSKQERYYYDADAIAEPASYPDPRAVDGFGDKSVNGKHDATDSQSAAVRVRKTDKQRGHSRRHAGFNDRWDAMDKAGQCSGKRNKRTVWTVATSPYSGAHFATFPPALIEPCILAGCPEGGTVLDAFGGSGTTGLVADRLRRNAVLCELNQTYAQMAAERIKADAGMFADVRTE